MVKDYRDHKDVDLDDFIEMFQTGKLSQIGHGGPINEARRQRAYRVDVAAELVKQAAKAGRALTPAELKQVDDLTEEARILDRLIQGAEAQRRKDLEESMRLSPIPQS